MDRRIRLPAAATAAPDGGGRTTPAAARDGWRDLRRGSVFFLWLLTMGAHRILGSESRYDQRAWYARELQTITRCVIVGHDSGLRRFRSGIDLVRPPKPKTDGRHQECLSEKASSFESGPGAGRSSCATRQSP